MDNNILNKSNEQNSFTIAGFVTNIRKTLKSIVVTVSTSPSRNKNYRDYPSIIFTGNLEKDVRDCMVGDHVIISCSMQTIPFKESRDGKTSFLIGKKIERQVSIIEKQTGIEAGLSYSDKNEGAVYGVVKHIFIPEKGNIAIVSIAAKNGTRASFPAVSCFDRCLDYVKNNVKEGDTVAVAAYIQTKNDRENNKFYETIVAREIVKMEE